VGIYSRDEIEKILKQYGDTIYRMAFVQVKKHDVAEDIYQEVCVKLLKQKARIEPEEHLKAWLLRTAINCCKDYWKSAWVKRLSWKEIEETSEVTVNAEEHDGYLTECVWRLPEKYRSLIHLYYYEDYSQKEIAEMLHMKENTVAIRLLRGREKLREMLMKEDRNYEF